MCLQGLWAAAYELEIAGAEVGVLREQEEVAVAAVIAVVVAVVAVIVATVVVVVIVIVVVVIGPSFPRSPSPRERAEHLTFRGSEACEPLTGARPETPRH